ncbi:MAG TPA: RNA 2',3'-cyclic phosphodiesterase [Dehalococcoidia bacterium]|nr:RNA 2',3'-cyclic phosphodiesterase [Dehalococcoidia bacterium]
MTPKPIRLFVAIELPDDVMAAIGELEDELSREAPHVRWARPDRVHLTLKFIGETPPNRLPEIEAALAGLPPWHALDLRTGPLGYFGRPSALRTIWLGVEGALDELRQLQAAVDEALVAAGVVNADDRPYTPHLTLARVPNGIAPDEHARMAALIKRTQVAPHAFEGHTITLFRSNLGPQRPRYEALRRFSAFAS